MCITHVYHAQSASDSGSVPVAFTPAARVVTSPPGTLGMAVGMEATRIPPQPRRPESEPHGMGQVGPEVVFLPQIIGLPEVIG